MAKKCTYRLLIVAALLACRAVACAQAPADSAEISRTGNVSRNGHYQLFWLRDSLGFGNNRFLLTIIFSGDTRPSYGFLLEIPTALLPDSNGKPAGSPMLALLAGNLGSAQSAGYRFLTMPATPGLGTNLFPLNGAFASRPAVGWNTGVSGNAFSAPGAGIVPSLPAPKNISLAGSLPGGVPSAGTMPNTSVILNGAGNVKNQVGSTTARLANVRSAMTGQALSGFKSINDAISQNFRSMPKATFGAELALSNDVQYNPVTLNPGGPKFYDVAGISGTVIFMGVPLSLAVSNNRASFNGANPLSPGLFRIGFNPSLGSALGLSPLQQYQQLRGSVFQGFNFTNYVQQTISNHVASLQSGSSNLKNSPFSNAVQNPDSLQSLVRLDQGHLHAKLDSMAVHDKSAIPADSSAASVAAANTRRERFLKQADSLAMVIISIKNQMASNGLDPSTVMLRENYLTGNAPAGFNTSEAASALAQKNPQNEVQSLLGGLKGLRIGSFGTTIPGATDGSGSQLLTGADFKVKLNRYPITLGFGSLSDINSLADQNYVSSDFTYPKTITYIGADMPKNVFGNVNIAVVSSFSSELNNVQYAIPTLPGNSVDLTITKSMNFNDFGHVTVDVSKSTTLYNSAFVPGGDAIILSKAGANYNLANNLFQSFAFGIRHDADIKALGVTDNAYFNYSGLGYQNAANSGYSGGDLRFGGDLKKSYLKNKVIVDLMADYSSMPMSYTADQKFLSYQVQADCKYKVDKDINFTMKFMGSSTSEDISGLSNMVYSSDKIEFDENNSYKLEGHPANTNISIAYQSYMQGDSTSSTSNQLNFMAIQSVAFKNSSLSVTVFYNQEMTSSPLLGDMLMADATYQYRIGKMLQMATGFTYLSNAGYAKQAGIKQTIDLIAKKHFDISASMDWMKNLVEPLYPDLYPSLRGELSIKYYLKLD